ncbi:MAG: hypothetical protein WDO14_10780 [Bacteroidota bacterium]
MKKEKMSLEKMKGVLSNVLSRDEMKEVMAGSGDPHCISYRCGGSGGTPTCLWDSYTNFCTCSGWFCSYAG